MFCRIESSKRMRRGPRSLTCPSNPLTNVHPSSAVDELLHIRHKVCTPGNPFMKERFMVIVMKERTGGKANENVSKRVILGNVPDIIRADVLPHVHLYNMYTTRVVTHILAGLLRGP